MLFDFAKGPLTPEQQYDVCILGAGAAGITLAIRLGRAGKRVALCEGGGLDYEDDSQEIYAGQTIGDPYFDLDIARLRYFGGSTNHWGGYCRSFEPTDFNRGYLGDDFRWPISHDDILPYLAEACEIVEISSDYRDRLVDEELGLRQVDFKYSPPVRFGEKFQAEIESSKNIDLFLNCNFTDLTGADRRVRSVKLRNYADQDLEIRANSVVFAMGGIDNSRQLLWMERLHGGSFFDRDLPIGRYWMEHPHFIIGEALIKSWDQANLYFALTEKMQKALGIMGCGVVVEEQGDSTTKRLIKDLLCVAPGVGAWAADLAGKKLICSYRFQAAWEQAPNRENRVALSDRAVDRFGVPQSELHWRKASIDRETMLASTQQFNAFILRENLGRLQLRDWVYQGDEYPDDDILAGYHHMGGTRMSYSPRYGVVDGNCKVFGAENLYVAGSSLYTTAGYNNPTLAIVQFALRLADHLVKVV
ncbi:GMC oxidoreductase [Ruegeria aquimaris]|uniref:GMC family oxidoreductase n=1 Tax=Ruegeria aquimaris TaxID=2984333 RepID=A0ABT3AQS5_9RHOB|nr:GMC family oxidoreductase [Ruegeria sp. XHP0148]MCV2891040.1 GMC family oxidoreductase [Ruegeria sp. XHP0148]